MARSLNPFGRLQDNALSPADLSRIQHNCRNPNEAKRHRRRVIRYMEGLITTLKPARGRLGGRLTGNAPARNLHIPLICDLARNIDYPDTSLTRDLVRGMPIVGDIPVTSTLPMKVAPAAMNLRDVKEFAAVTNRKVVKSLSKSTDLLLRRECWGLPHEEVQKGWLSGPSLVTSNDLEMRFHHQGFVYRDIMAYRNRCSA